ncbi:MAG TPA: hypothetical protein VK549_10295 [Acidimicrobiia bacterium]|nr:hypothetical protein [Acidimicrobiia bacterium]
MRSSFVMNRQVCQTATCDATTIPEARLTTRETGAVHKTVRRLLGIGILAGVAYSVWRTLPTRPESGTHWEPQPFPFPPRPSVDLDRAEPPWIDPADSGACPAHHPVKGKLRSGIFHVPGGANYTRTAADRCYVSVEAAEADGLRASRN